MKKFRWVAGVLALMCLLTTVFTASARANLRHALLTETTNTRTEAARAGCTSMTASEVIWVTLNDEGDIDEQVKGYPAEATNITPFFEYNCIPKKTNLVTIFTLDGEQVYTDKETLKASNAKGRYSYPLSTDDGSPIPEGTWGVEFYNNKTLLASGEVVVGEQITADNPNSANVTVEGTITDKKSKKAIKNAVVLILKPGITVQEFVAGGQKEKDVFTAGQSDSKGHYVLAEQLARNTDYSIIVVAKGYKPTATDGFRIDAADPDPVPLNITMNK